MPQSNPNMPICRDCDGFATVAIDTGARHLDGTRVTLRVDCPTCKGTGQMTRTTVLIRAAR
ncbi:hypothetical protein [Streptomyces spiralis]|uniref:hypothetical protein n=1 Tax=Streptomyces spiralis TaxID=66376 RepID=UPI0033C91C34